MKKLLPIAFFFLSLKIFSLPNFYISPKPHLASFDSLEVFVSITFNDNKTFSKVKAAMNTMSGLNYFLYCSNHSVFMVYIDKNVYGTKNDFLEQLIKLVPEFTESINLKNGAFKDLAGNCITTNETEASAIKNNFAK